MSSEGETDAPPAVTPTSEDWMTIPWRKLEVRVFRLQKRIIQAQRRGNVQAAHSLQRLLMKSWSARAIAMRRVTQDNQGKKTAGVDGVKAVGPLVRLLFVERLRHHAAIQPRPVRRVLIPKPGKPGACRPLGIPVLLDRAQQYLAKLALEPQLESRFEGNSYGFRPGRAPHDALAAIFLASSRKAKYVLDADLKGAFDRISHDWLVAHIPMEKRILQQWLKAGYLDKHVLHPTEEGTPQGGIASPVLANRALDGLERRLRDAFPRTTTKGKRAKVNLIRYADDFVITGSSRELLADEVTPLVEDFLRERGLARSAEKTSITHSEDGFDFLGQHVRKYRQGTQVKLLITPSRKHVATFLGKVRQIVKDHRQAPAGELILQLNPLIRGWARYHRHVVSTRTFAKVTHAIFLLLWRWARRRHPNKGKRWIKHRYFRATATRDWIFAGRLTAPNGDLQQVRLYEAASMPITQHTKIQAAANPYDPRWEVYCEDRTGRKMAQTLLGKGRLLALWRAQHGTCPVCNQPITRRSGWHRHHLVWRSKGGGEQAANLVLLHPTCHRQVHSQHISVAKPRPAKGVGAA